MTEPVDFAVDAFPTDPELTPLWQAVWGHKGPFGYQHVLARSLCHVTARVGGRLIGFVNVATDGGVHAFLLDTTVHPDFQRRGIAKDLVRRATAVARERGAHWLHVDFEPHLEPFYRQCGFQPTAAGLIRL